MMLKCAVSIGCLCFLATSARAQEINITVKPPSIEDHTEAGKSYKAKITIVSVTNDLSQFKITPSKLIFTDEAGNANANKDVEAAKIKVENPPSQIVHGDKGSDINLTVDGMSVGDYKGSLTLGADKTLKPSTVPIHIKVNAAVASNTSGATVLPSAAALAMPTGSLSIIEQSDSEPKGDSSLDLAKVFARLPETFSLFTGGVYNEGRVLAFRAVDKSVSTGTLYYVENPDTAASTLPLPAKCLKASLLEETVSGNVAGNKDASGSLTLNLDVNKMTRVQVCVYAEDLAPGRYSGSYNLLIPDRAPLSIPITLTRRTRPLWAILWLIGGVSFGVALAAYRTRQLASDQVRARIGRLQTRILQETSFRPDAAGRPAVGAVFADRLQAKINQALNFVEDQSASAATKLDEADVVFARWTEHQSDWIVQLDYVHKLLSDIRSAATSAGGMPPYLEKLGTKLDVAEKAAPDQPDATELRTTAANVTDWFRAYQDAAKRFGVLEQLLAQADALPAKTPEDQEAIASIMSRRTAYSQVGALDPEVVNKLNPDNTTALGKTIADEQKDIDDVTTIIRRLAASPRAALGVAPPAPSPPLLTTGTTVEMGRAAESRIQWFYGLSYSGLAVLLVMAGFNQVYWPNATFGAAPIDFMTLIAWGFGVDTLTRPAILGAFNYLELTVNGTTGSAANPPPAPH